MKTSDRVFVSFMFAETIKISGGIIMGVVIPLFKTKAPQSVFALDEEEKLRVKIIQSSLEALKREEKMVEAEISEKCRNCILYPICKGGCRAAELKLADLNQCILYKSCLDKILEKILLYDLQQ